METRTCLSRHYEFISPENIAILSVPSDDFLQAFLEISEQQMWNYSSYKVIWRDGEYSNILCRKKFILMTKPSLSFHPIPIANVVCMLAERSKT